jgi:hypothetical protein
LKKKEEAKINQEEFNHTRMWIKKEEEGIE